METVDPILALSALVQEAEIYAKKVYDNNIDSTEKLSEIDQARIVGSLSRIMDMKMRLDLLAWKIFPVLKPVK